jgi:chemotaxis protein MotB
MAVREADRSWRRPYEFSANDTEDVGTITPDEPSAQTRRDRLKFLTVQHVLLWFAKEHSSEENPQRNRPMKTLMPLIFILSFGIGALPDGVSAQTRDTDAVRYGEAAIVFSSGAIQKTTPRDGIVNLITGDNQLSGNRMLMGKQDIFYLKLDNPAEVAVGDLFTVYKRARKVFHPVTNEYLGFVVIRLAVVRVTDTNHALTTVESLTSYAQVSPGDPVVRFVAPSPHDGVSPVSNVADLSGMIVEVQADRTMTMVAQSNVVYVDHGSAEGLRAGDLLEIHRHSAGLPPRKIGQLKVLSTEEHTATARVTKAITRVFKGDRFKAIGQSMPVAQPIELTPLKSEQAMVPSDLVASQLKTRDESGQSRINLGDLANSLRYESGEAAIKSEGYRVLDQLIEYLRTNDDTRLIRVEGHTDNVEIGPSLKSRYPTNWELAKARANGVVRYLVEKGGLDSARLSAVGYGDSKPAVTNANEEGRTKNRRVEVLLYNPDAEATDSKLEGSNNHLAAPPNTARRSGSGTFAIGEQRQASSGDGMASPNAYDANGSMAPGSESRSQASASGGEGATPANNPSTGSTGSSDPAKQDPSAPANVPGF